MAEVLLFHHAMGQTEGLHAFADELRGAGHTVHPCPAAVPDSSLPPYDEGALRLLTQRVLAFLEARG